MNRNNPSCKDTQTRLVASALACFWKTNKGSENALSRKVSCLALSPSGRYLASGQLNFMGLKADIIIWDLSTLSLLHRMSLHKVGFAALVAGIQAAH